MKFLLQIISIIISIVLLFSSCRINLRFHSWHLNAEIDSFINNHLGPESEVKYGIVTKHGDTNSIWFYCDLKKDTDFDTFKPLNKYIYAIAILNNESKFPIYLTEAFPVIRKVKGKKYCEGRDRYGWNDFYIECISTNKLRSYRLIKIESNYQ